MKHKQDAIKNAEEIISAHMKYGLDLIQAQKAAMVSIENQSRFGYYESLHQRTLNYLYTLVFGEEDCIKLMAIKQSLRKEYNSYKFLDKESEAKINKLEDEIESIKSKAYE